MGDIHGFFQKKVRNKNFTILLIENCQQYQEETKQNITHGKISKNVRKQKFEKLRTEKNRKYEEAKFQHLTHGFFY